MEIDSQESWEIRKLLQQFPLIGTSSKDDDGNGYHDRISFYERGLRSANSFDSPKNLFFEQYFNNIYQALTHIRYDRSQPIYTLVNCSSEYEKTFDLYVGVDRRPYSISELPLFYLKMAGDVIHDGVAAFEFVRWKDKESDVFYGFELSEIIGNIQFNHNELVQKIEFEDQSGVVTRIERKIPKNKCIIVEWPQKLGGVDLFKKVRDNAYKISDGSGLMFDPNNPRERMNQLRSGEINFFKQVSQWGAMNPTYKTNEFHKIYSMLKFKQTICFIMEELQGGFKQVVTHLNTELNEDARIEFNFPSVNLKNSFKELASWSKGELTTTQASYLVSPYR